MKHFYKLGNAMLVLLFVATAVVAQPGMPGAPTQSPIDGGLGLLALAGGAYALKKMKSKREE